MANGRKPRSGSEKRRRNKLTAHRWFEDEFREAAARAERAGLSFGAYIRAAALGDAGPRAQRRPPVDAVLLRQAIGQQGRIGNNVNQIAHALNIGEQVPLPEVKRALTACYEIRNMIFEALGKHPSPEP